MSDKLSIVITGNASSASAVFKEVTAGAATMGTAVEQSGQRAGRSFEDFNRKAAALGAGIATVTGILSDWSRAAIEDQAEQARLQQAIDNTGKSYSNYGKAVNDAIAAGQKKAFTDTQIRDALVSLTAVTNDAGASLGQLGLVEDFARAKGIDLATSAEIIAKVYGGNLGILSRYGITLDANATSTEALAKIQQISAGQADTYAKSTAGWLEELKIKGDELTESWGYQLGAAQKVLAILPGLSAGFSGLSAAIGGLGGAAGVASAGGFAAALALLVGSGAYAYNLNTQKGGWAENATASTLSGAAGVANFLTPGNPFSGIQDQFKDLKSSGNLSKIASSVFYSGTGNTSDQFYLGQLIEAGVLPTGFKGTLADAADYITTAAKATGMSNQSYVSGHIASSTAYVYDPVGQKYVAKGDYPALQNRRYFDAGGNLTSGATTMGYGTIAGMGQGPTGPGAGYAAWLASNSPHFSSPQGGNFLANAMYGSNLPNYQAGGAGAVANDISGQVANGAPARPITTGAQQQAQEQNALTEALGRLNSAYLGLTDGVMKASDAQATYKAVQDGILGQEGVYSQQQSEYSSQVSAITAAHDLLNQKVAEGIPLTKEQQEFQDNYNAALERGNGAVDDATISQGMLAEQYLLNMQKGDQLNQSMQEQTNSVGGLTTMIADLILSLDNVPDEVKTQVLLDKYTATQDIADYISYLNSIPLSRTTTLYTVETGVYQAGSDGVAGHTRGSRLGGVAGYARGGVVIRAGEAGMELMSMPNGNTGLALTDGLYNVPRGTYVDTAPATKNKLAGLGGVHIASANFYFSGFQTQEQVSRQIDQFALGGSR